MNNEIKNAIAAKFNLETETVENAFMSTKSVNAACKILQIPPSTVRRVMKHFVETSQPTVETVETETAIVPVETTVEPVEIVETETVEPANELETVPVKTMLERMRETEIDRAPRVEISKLFKMKCKSEIVFFRDTRKMFEPTETEIAEMREIAARIFADLPETNKLNEPCEYVTAKPETALTLQYDKQTSKPKSAFFIADELSYQIAVRFSA